MLGIGRCLLDLGLVAHTFPAGGGFCGLRWHALLRFELRVFRQFCQIILTHVDAWNHHQQKHLHSLVIMQT